MAVSVKCTCGRDLRVRDEDAGKRTKCGLCGAEIIVPSSNAPIEALAVELHDTEQGGKEDGLAAARRQRKLERQIKQAEAKRRARLNWIVGSVAGVIILLMAVGLTIAVLANRSTDRKLQDTGNARPIYDFSRMATSGPPTQRVRSSIRATSAPQGSTAPK
jgi:hypothetical protein